MNIEITDDLCNHLADLLGVYGCCKHAAKNKPCEEKAITCCRIGFMIEMPERMRAAVEAEKKLNQVGL